MRVGIKLLSSEKKETNNWHTSKVACPGYDAPSFKH
jgi:hypothetical protein